MISPTFVIELSSCNEKAKHKQKQMEVEPKVYNEKIHREGGRATSREREK